MKHVLASVQYIYMYIFLDLDLNSFILDLLHEKDRKIAMLCKEKTQIIFEMLETIDRRDEKMVSFSDHNICLFNVCII